MVKKLTGASFFLIVFIFIFAGCADMSFENKTVPNEQKFTESWRGSTKENIINRFGPPDQVFKDSLGNDSFSYIKRGPTDSMHFIFTFNTAGKVSIVRADEFMDQQQIDEARDNANRARDDANRLYRAGQRGASGGNRFNGY